MKKTSLNIVLPLIILLSICFTDCSKKLNEKAFSEDTPGNFYQTANQVTAAYVLPYSYLQTHIYQVHFQDVEFVTDEACVLALYGGLDQGGQWIRFHQHA